MKLFALAVAVVLLLVQAVAPVEAKGKPTSGWTTIARGDGALD